MKIFDLEKAERIKMTLSVMTDPVKILVFLGNNVKSKETQQFLLEFVKFSPKLSLEMYNHPATSFQATPMIILTDQDKIMRGTRFLGTPGGFEINSFLMAILDLSGQGEALSTGEKVVLDRLRKPLEIFVYVSLNCMRCSQAVMFVHRLASQTPFINAYMVEADAFPQMTEKENIDVYPTMKIGDHLLIGDHATNVEKIMQTIKSTL